MELNESYPLGEPQSALGYFYLINNTVSMILILNE
jgi:hypothetical protein